MATERILDLRIDRKSRASEFDGGELTVVLEEGLGGGGARGRRGRKALGSHGPGRGSEPGNPRPPRLAADATATPLVHTSPISRESEPSRHDTEASARRQEVREGDERERDVDFGGGPGCQGSASAEVGIEWVHTSVSDSVSQPVVTGLTETRRAASG